MIEPVSEMVCVFVQMNMIPL